LVLGALRGWGDINQDGDITSSEVIKYSNEVLIGLEKGRRQTPVMYGEEKNKVLSTAWEKGPDLHELHIETQIKPQVTVPQPKKTQRLKKKNVSLYATSFLAITATIFTSRFIKIKETMYEFCDYDGLCLEDVDEMREQEKTTAMLADIGWGLTLAGSIMTMIQVKKQKEND
jgi:hypothetical protein